MNSNLIKLFFTELKQYNGTNFRALRDADLDNASFSEKKAFSSTITRYLIFAEKHPEISLSELNLLYYQLKLDMVARYFANYPASTPEELKPFQLELKNYLIDNKIA